MEGVLTSAPFFRGVFIYCSYYSIYFTITHDSVTM